MDEQTEYTYTGPVYIRPIGRGVVLDPDGAEGDLDFDLSYAFPDGDYNMEIVFRVLPLEEPE